MVVEGSNNVQYRFLRPHCSALCPGEQPAAGLAASVPPRIRLRPFRGVCPRRCFSGLVFSSGYQNRFQKSLLGCDLSLQEELELWKPACLVSDHQELYSRI